VSTRTFSISLSESDRLASHAWHRLDAARDELGKVRDELLRVREASIAKEAHLRAEAAAREVELLAEARVKTACFLIFFLDICIHVLVRVELLRVREAAVATDIRLRKEAAEREVELLAEARVRILIKKTSFTWVLSQAPKNLGSR